MELDQPGVQQPSARVAPWMWAVAAGSMVLALAGAVFTAESGVTVPAVWAVGSVALVSYSWGLRLEGATLRRFLLGMTLMLATLMTPAFLLIGLDPARAAWCALANCVQALLGLVLYRRLGSAFWPRSAADMGALLLALLIAAVVGLLLGSDPLAAGWSLDPEVWVPWLVRCTVYGFIGFACVVGLVETWVGLPDASRTWGELAAVTVAGIAAFTALLEWRDLPLTWLLMVAAIWAGSVLAPWTAALHTFTVANTAAALSTVPRFDATDTAPLATRVTVDLLVMVYVGVTMLLVVVREQRNGAMRAMAEARADAEAQATMLQVAIDSMSDGLLLVDEGRRVEMANLSARRLLSRGVPGQSVETWLRDVGDVDDRLADLLAGGSGGSQITLVSEGGLDAVVMELEAQPVVIAGLPRHAVFVRDVTTVQQRIAELTDFAAVAAHDLRSPLTAVRGWMEAAQESLEEPDLADAHLRRATAATDRMADNIEGWLSYAVAREGELTPSRIDLGSLVLDLAELYRDRAEITAVPGPDVMADRMLLEQVVTNLVTNAIKYAGRPVVPIEISTETADEAGWVRVIVDNRGEPVSEEAEQRIFEPFVRGAFVDGVPGTGLGLALCRRIVQRHGGRMWLEVDRGLDPGNRMCFTLPAAQCGSEARIG